jgi:hypothetical protein
MKYIMRMTPEEIFTLDFAMKIARSERNERLKKDEARRFRELHVKIATAMLILHPEED